MLSSPESVPLNLATSYRPQVPCNVRLHDFLTIPMPLSEIYRHTLTRFEINVCT